MQLPSFRKLIIEFPREALLPWKTIILLSLLLLAENGSALLPPWILGSLADYLVGQNPGHSLQYLSLLGLWLLVVIGQNILFYFNELELMFQCESIIYKLRTKLYNHLQSLPLSYFVTHQKGQILSTLTHDIGIIASFATTTATGVLPYLLTSLGALCCLFYLNTIVAVSCLLLLPIMVISIKLLGRPINRLSKQLMQVHGATLAVAEENLSNIATIKAYGGEPHESARFAESCEKLFVTSQSFYAAQARIAPLIRGIGSVIVICILLLAGKYLSATTISPGRLVTIVLFGMFLVRPLSSLASLYGQTQRALAAASRLKEIYNISTEPLNEGHDILSVSGKITIENVSFGYPGSPQLLCNLNLTIAPHETIAITGENGAGKSTLAHLLLRLYEPQRGRITLDGRDIKEMSLSTLRSHFAIVQQTALLRNGSIRENMLLAKADATEGELIVACRRAQAWDFIQKMPEGLDSVIGDQGMKLSGGQQQRIALARALLKNPAVLILDEATAMFDPEGENQFIAKNAELFNQYTVIIITHRPATLSLADRVYRLENGRLHQLA